MPIPEALKKAWDEANLLTESGDPKGALVILRSEAWDACENGAQKARTLCFAGDAGTVLGEVDAANQKRHWRRAHKNYGKALNFDANATEIPVKNPSKDLFSQRKDWGGHPWKNVVLLDKEFIGYKKIDKTPDGYKLVGCSRGYFGTKKAPPGARPSSRGRPRETLRKADRGSPASTRSSVTRLRSDRPA